MNQKTPRLELIYKIAIVCLFMTGVFPITVGTFFYFQFFSFDTVYQVEHVAFTNLIAVGLVACTLALFSRRSDFRPWTLFLSTFLLMWSGGNDFFVLTKYYLSPASKYVVFPFPILPLTTGSIGIVLATIYYSEELGKLKYVIRTFLGFGLITIFTITFVAIKNDSARVAMELPASKMKFRSSVLGKPRLCPEQLKRICCVDKNCKVKQECPKRKMECDKQSNANFCFQYSWLDESRDEQSCSQCDGLGAEVSSLKTFRECV